jgi:hypothetical protein
MSRILAFWVISNFLANSFGEAAMFSKLLPPRMAGQLVSRKIAPPATGRTGYSKLMALSVDLVLEERSRAESLSKA